MKKNDLGQEDGAKGNIRSPVKFAEESVARMIGYLALALCFGGSWGSGAGVEWAPGCPSGALDVALEGLMRGGPEIELSEGVRFVKVNESAEGEGGRSARDSVLSRVKRFLTNYELQVKLSDLFRRKQDMMDTFRRALISLNELQGGNEETSRGKGNSGFGGGKKGGGGILMMATMMGGMMAALGFGALGMLVMKALTVSSMALLLSAVIGLRRLIRRPDDDAGFNRISYIPVHTEHRRRRRFLEVPYRAHARRG